MRAITTFSMLFSLLLFSKCETETIEINTAKQPEGTSILKQKIFVPDVNSDQAQGVIDYEYFNNGKLKKERFRDKEGKILSYSSYRYNIKNQLHKIIEFTANANYPNGFIKLTTHEFEYLTNKLKRKETIKHLIVGTSEQITFGYNSKGDLIKKTYYNSNNELIKYDIFTYDEFGNILKETSFSAEGEQTGETLHYYQNNMLYKSDVYIFGKDKVLLEEIIRSYDENNNLIMLQLNVKWVASSRSSSVIKFIYD